MVARDRDIAHVASVDDVDTATTAAVSESPPRRDPEEDADASFTRKRPRLDGGENSVRALSHDMDASDTTAASPRDQQVEMTIRPHPHSSPISAAVPDDQSANGNFEPPQDTSPILIATTEDDLGSPPVVVIEDDDDDDESADGISVQVDAEDYFWRFPCAGDDYAKAVRELPRYFNDCEC